MTGEPAGPQHQRRLLPSRLAHWISLGVLLGVAGFSCSLRLGTYRLTGQVQTVISGMARIEIDQTTEEQLLRIVPNLSRDPNGPTTYRVEITNFDRSLSSFDWVPRFAYRIWSGRLPIDKGLQSRSEALFLPQRVASWLGWRHFYFAASFKISDGTVSKMGYVLEPDVFLGWPKAELVSMRTVRGYLHDSWAPAEIDSRGDDTPDFRFGRIAGEFSYFAGEAQKIAVAYTPTAAREKVAHAFQLNLACFWGLTGCNSVRQVVPQLWEDREALTRLTEARLESDNPCPAELLAGRVRTLPDLTVALVEVVRSQPGEFNFGGGAESVIETDYRLLEALVGKPHDALTSVPLRQTIPWPPGSTGRIANPVASSIPQPGDRFLFFSGATFESCRIAPATPSAVSAVRDAIPAPRLREDMMPRYRQ